MKKPFQFTNIFIQTIREEIKVHTQEQQHKAITQKNTLLQFAQATAQTKNCKRVFSPAQEEFETFSPSLLARVSRVPIYNISTLRD